MFDLPRDLLSALSKRADKRALHELMEYRLSSGDVAKLLDCSLVSIRTYSTGGKAGVMLRHRTFRATKEVRPMRAYRLADVEAFARLFDMIIRYDTLHPMLQREWKVGPLGSPQEKE